MIVKYCMPEFIVKAYKMIQDTLNLIVSGTSNSIIL